VTGAPAGESLVSKIDALFLARAIELAEAGVFSVTANPRVGCIIVRDGEILGRGAHLRAGDAHAEAQALADAKQSVSGATVYVSLEPCSIVGRTPACARALVEAGVARVVCAAIDPHPDVAGAGLKLLADAGIEVAVIEMPSARQLNYGRDRLMRRGWPYVRVKVAQSLDGRTAMRSGESKWITSAQARRDVQYWRARSGAIVTGIGTVLADDPALTVRDPLFAVRVSPTEAVTRQPLRVVLDSRLRTSTTAQVCTDGGATLLVHAGASSAASLPAHPDAGFAECVEIWASGADSRTPAAGGDYDRCDLLSVLRKLGERGCSEVLIEAGAGLVGSVLKSELWDELLVYTAPKFLGASARASAEINLAHMSEAIEAKIVSTDLIGGDVRTRLIPTAVDSAEVDIEPLGYPDELKRTW